MVLNRQDGFWAISYPLKVKPTVVRVREGLGNVTAFPTLSFQTRFPLQDRKLQGGRIQILCLSGVDMEKQDRLCGVMVHLCCHLASPSPLAAGLSKELCYRWHLCTYNPPITQGNANTEQDLMLLVVTLMHASFWETRAQRGCSQGPTYSYNILMWYITTGWSLQYYILC